MSDCGKRKVLVMKRWAGELIIHPTHNPNSFSLSGYVKRLIASSVPCWAQMSMKSLSISNLPSFTKTWRSMLKRRHIIGE